jgi:two-component system sensor kinase FixL
MSECLTATQELQALLDAAVDAIVWIDHRGRIEGFNRAAERLFGYAEAEIRGRSVSTLMPDPEGSAHDAYIRRYLESGVPHIIGIGREVNARRRDGTVFPACIAVGEIARSNPPRFVGFLRDITVQKQLLEEVKRQRDAERRTQDEARRAQERLTHVARLATLGEMAAGISHELNQPLAAITNYAHACVRLLGREPPGLDEVREALEQIAAQSLRAGEIIRRLRSLVRRQETHRVLASINDSIRELIPLAATDGRLHDVRLHFELEESLPPICIDPVQIQQVLLNLLHNAIEALGAAPPERRDIAVRSALGADGMVEVSVTDSGPGVAPSILERLFDPFCTTKATGTGLGLAISRSIVDAHRGTLRYAPAAAGGACFTLRLPAAAGDNTSGEIPC